MQIRRGGEVLTVKVAWTLKPAAPVTEAVASDSAPVTLEALVAASMPAETPHVRSAAEHDVPSAASEPAHDAVSAEPLSPEALPGMDMAERNRIQLGKPPRSPHLTEYLDWRRSQSRAVNYSAAAEYDQFAEFERL